MKNLVLGGAGFIGQHLTHKLLYTRHARVVAVDNLKTSKINLDDFEEYKNLYEFVEADITEMDESVLSKLIRKSDRIWWLAGSVGVEHIDKNPEETFFNNFNLNSKLIPLLRNCKKPIIFTSTSEIYGDGPFAEDDKANIRTDKLRAAYAASKLYTEFALKSMPNDVTILRLFNVVGPGQLGDYGMVLPRFIEAAKKNEDLIVYGDGTQVRSFCHVKDAVDMIVDMVKTPQTYNVGNSSPIEIKELAQRVINLVGSSSKIRYVPYNEAFSDNHADIDYRCPDMSKVKHIYNYYIDDIIKDML